MAIVEARIGAASAHRRQEAERAEQIRGACQIAHLPQLADGYLHMQASVADVCAQLATITALVDATRGEIDTSLLPDAGPRPRGLRVAEVYRGRADAQGGGR